ncbi:hypothetical protein [Streptomyces sp. NPDC090298]|uniref:hypothetical protein n=1 Tax=Streptomyces sp. NPDC090298 TaxID=3365959 RepID=UPI00380C625E
MRNHHDPSEHRTRVPSPRHAPDAYPGTPDTWGETGGAGAAGAQPLDDRTGPASPGSAPLRSDVPAQRLTSPQAPQAPSAPPPAPPIPPRPFADPAAGPTGHEVQEGHESHVVHDGHEVQEGHEGHPRHAKPAPQGLPQDPPGDVPPSGAPDHRGEHARPVRPDGAAGDEELPDLLDDAEQEAFLTRWHEVQGRFVDDPRQAVHAADVLVGDVMRTLADTFGRHRGALEGQWSQGLEADTESLRRALCQYRALFQRLLSA